MLPPLPSSIIRRFEQVCAVAAPQRMLAVLRANFFREGLSAAVALHHNPTLFDWLIGIINYQGVADSIAEGYMAQYGSVAWSDLQATLASSPACPKLHSHWHFEGCRFAKSAFACAEPAHLRRCPLPTHDMRNGRLNQAAYSLFLFLRDVCDGDLVGWIDDRLATVEPGSAGSDARLRQAVIEPLLSVYGISFKVISMALSDLLLAGDPARERWVEAGAGMVVVDTLVHNWLHRTGSLREMGAEHPYGAGCYAPGGCAHLIEAASRHIDARSFCPDGPAMFPRLVQKAIWLFCTEGGLDQCNGHRINDRHRCGLSACSLWSCCDRVVLAPAKMR